jgi:hypothetical protein
MPGLFLQLLNHTCNTKDDSPRVIAAEANAAHRHMRESPEKEVAVVHVAKHGFYALPCCLKSPSCSIYIQATDFTCKCKGRWRYQTKQNQPAISHVLQKVVAAAAAVAAAFCGSVPHAGSPRNGCYPNSVFH